MRTLWVLIMALPLLASSIALMVCGSDDDIEEENIADVVVEGLRARSHMLLIEVVGEGRNVYDEEGKKQFFVVTFTDFCKSPETGT